MRLPSESECRRPGWREGVPVVLADGCTWQAPVVVPRWDGGRLELLANGRDIPGMSERMIRDARRTRAYRRAGGDPRGEALDNLLHAARLAGMALRANYRIAPSAARWLACWGFLDRGDMDGLHASIDGIVNGGIDVAYVAEVTGRWVAGRDR